MKLQQAKPKVSCPFCKSSKVRITHKQDNSGNTVEKQADCTDCGAKGPKVQSFKQYHKGISVHA